ncbi:hypothetical protein J1614_007782 [Plenodomus biglobosus]|nr:hypothetical protein J1614_007782 [Plenodomus biglobosus]
MLFSTSTPFLLTAALLSSPSHAAPTRTTCHCTIVSDAPSPAENTPSTAHWMPSDPSPSPATPDTCAALGPQLDDFRHTEPAVYNAYMQQAQAPHHAATPQPIPSTILLAFAAHRRPGTGAGTGTGKGRSSSSSENQHNAPTTTRAQQISQPLERIVCRSVPSPDQSDTYQDSLLNLWISQIIIAVAILACAAEGIHIGMCWITKHTSTPTDDTNTTTTTTTTSLPALHLSGPEKPLLAIPPSSTTAATAPLDMLASPGADKKTRAYEHMRFFGGQGRAGRREFVAYEDGEEGRPVM